MYNTLLFLANVPQALLTHESVNRIYGLTVNSWNKERACGGSTGGEVNILF